VVVALQMQHTMHNHVGVVGFRRLALLLGLALDHLAAQHQVAANALAGFVGEGEHVGGVVLAPVVAIEGLPFDAATKRTATSAGSAQLARSQRRTCGLLGSAAAAARVLHREPQFRQAACGRHCVVFLVGVNDARHERMAHHVGGIEIGEGQAAHVLEDAPCLDQAGRLPARQVHLRDVAGDHRAGTDADAGEEHFHLLGRCVLRLVQDDEGMIQGAAAHVGQRCDFDVLLLEQLGDLVEAHQVIQRVIEWTQVGVDLLRQVTGEKAEPFAGFHGRSRQHDAADLVALEGVDGAGHGKVGLAGAGRADAEGDVVFLDLAQVVDLVRRAAVQVALARLQAGAGRLRGGRPCALRLRMISIRPSWISSIDKASAACS
jgi:hypothetical protein